MANKQEQDKIPPELRVIGRGIKKAWNRASEFFDEQEKAQEQKKEDAKDAKSDIEIVRQALRNYNGALFNCALGLTNRDNIKNHPSLDAFERLVARLK